MILLPTTPMRMSRREKQEEGWEGGGSARGQQGSRAEVAIGRKPLNNAGAAAAVATATVAQPVELLPPPLVRVPPLARDLVGSSSSCSSLSSPACTPSGRLGHLLLQHLLQQQQQQRLVKPLPWL